MIEQRNPAPEFTLTSDRGEEVSLSDFRGQKVIIYFYPKADTPGCTQQACSVRDNYATITAQDAVVIGISPDEPEDLRRFREKYDLPFILLSDPDHEVAEAYGVADEGIIRSHFAVDAEGQIIEAERGVKPVTTADLALKIIEI
ncbi:MAG: peroxiredoxin [Anaerolineales bacterium]